MVSTGIKSLLVLFLFSSMLFFSESIVASDAGENKSLKSTILTDSSSIKRGKKRFNSLCVYCHGNQGVGGKSKPLQGREFDPDYLYRTISEGMKRGSMIMPPWKNSLSEEERWELVAYILSLGSIGKESD